MVRRMMAAQWTSSDNPDTSRHFCTSARELLSSLLEFVAPDQEVLTADPDRPLTPNGSVSRRALVRHCLVRQGTHEDAGRFDLVALTAIKQRVEGAIQFVARISGAHN